jgi:transcriptional regulator with XRE-family HTH domain
MSTKPGAGHRISPKDLTPEQRASYEKLKAKALADREAGLLGPPVERLDVERGEGAPFYFELQACVAELKRAREAAELTLAQVAEKTGLAAETLCRLETGQVTNPTWKTLGLYAAAVGRSLVLTANQILTPCKRVSNTTREKGTSMFIWDVINPTRNSSVLRLVVTPRGPDGSHVDPSLRLERNVGRNNAVNLATRILEMCGASAELLEQVNALRDGEPEEE